MRGLASVFQLNGKVNKIQMKTVEVMWLGLIILLWSTVKIPFFPQPLEVGTAFVKLVAKEGMIGELLTSISTIFEALLIATGLSLVLAYTTAYPVFRPLINYVTKGRFLGMTGLTLTFAILFPQAHWQKVAILAFAIFVFFVTSMVSEVESIPKANYDHARTLRMRDLQVIWEVVVLGTADRALDLMRQNAAMAWVMLTFVEGIVRSEGGLGTLLFDHAKLMHQGEVWAIVLTFLVTGLIADWLLRLIRKIFCPYAFLATSR